MKKIQILLVALTVGLLASCATTGKSDSAPKKKSGGVGYFLSGIYENTHQRVLAWAEYYGLEVEKDDAKHKITVINNVSFKFGDTVYWTDVEVSWPEKNAGELYVECTNLGIGEERAEPDDNEYLILRSALDFFLSGLRTGDFLYPKNREFVAEDDDLVSSEMDAE